MKSVFAIPVLFLAHVAFAQESASASGSQTGSSSYAPSATGTAASQSVTGTATGSDYASASGSAKSNGTSYAPSSTVGSSSAIPTGVSAGCDAYLTALDNDASFSACTLPLLTATNAFSPAANNTNPSNATITATLNTLCSAPGCPSSYLRTQLADFYAACKAELTSNNTAVLETYDMLYVLEPLTKAVCTKDNGTYCVLKPAAGASSSSSNSGGVNNAASSGDASLVSNAASNVQKNGVVYGSGLSRRAAQTTVQYSPNMTVYREDGVMYLFAMPSLSSASLCTNCTSQVMAAYAAWEGTVPYGAGLINSPMLGGQAQLWTQIDSKCGSSFVSTIQAQSGPASDPAAASAAFKPSLSLAGGLATVLTLAVSMWIAL